MGILASLFTSGLAKPIEAFGDLLDKVTDTDEEKLQAQAVLEKIRQHPAELQAAINIMEAQSTSTYKGGWRPFIGYVCGIGLAFPFVINPCLQWYTGDSGPQMPLDAILDLVIAMLGLSGVRTYEKLKGITK